MFCPKCEAEYREGFTTCSDCHIPLIEQLPEELEASDYKPEYVEFKPLLSTYNSGDIAFIKSIFDSENINYYFKGENFHFVRPAVQPAILMVEENQVKDALTLLRDIDLTYMLLSTDKTDNDE